MNCVTQEVKDLCHILEHEFLPTHLALQVQPLLTKISKLGGRLATASSVPEVQLSQYVPLLEKLAALRLLQRVCFATSSHSASSATLLSSDIILVLCYMFYVSRYHRCIRL